MQARIDTKVRLAAHVRASVHPAIDRLAAKQITPLRTIDTISLRARRLSTTAT